MNKRLLLCGVMLAAACNIFTPVPTLTPVPTASATASRVPSATPSPAPTGTATTLPTATFTATPSPAPTATFTPLSSPTPQGYYAHPTAGFSVIYPSDWSVRQADQESVELADASDLLSIGILHDTTPGAPTFETEIAIFTKALNAPFTFKRTATGQAQLAEGVMADTVDLTGTDAKGRKWTVRLAYAKVDGWIYVMDIVAPSQALADSGQTVAQILASVHLNHDVFGLPRHQTLVLAGSDPSGAALDPALTLGGAGGYVGLLYSGLVRLSPQLQILPDLAENWVISPGGDTYTFTLRANLTFQSGAPITAQSVKESWERSANPKTHSPTAATYLNDIVGASDMLAGKASHMSGLTVLDDRTLVVQLDGPKAYFLAKLTYPTAFVLDVAGIASASDSWMFYPNASGPYTLKDNQPGAALIFERNLAYYAQAQVPYVVFRENYTGTPLEAYQAGDLDLAGVGPADVLQVRSTSDPLHAEWQSVTSMCTTMLVLDVSKPPLDDLAVRQALAMALDRDTLIQRLVANVAVRADTLLPPGMPGYSSDLPRFPFDANAARARLAQSRYAANMPELVLNEAGQGGQPSPFLTAVAEMWRQNLGLKIQIKQLDPASYVKAAREQHGNIVTNGWCADYPDPQNFLDILFHTGGDFNVGTYSNAQVDGWLEAARTEANPGQRLALYHEVENELLGSVALIPWITNLRDVVVKPYVKGYVLAPLDLDIIPQLSLDYGDAHR